VNDILKQRLVGALILVALGVIFWPIIFVQPNSVEDALQRDIPPRPSIDTSPIQPPDQVGLRTPKAAQARVEERFEVESSVEVHETIDPAPVDLPDPSGSRLGSPVDSPKDRPSASDQVDTPAPPMAPLAMDADGVPIAWILQVASVSEATKAESLRERLLEMEQKAFVKRVSSGGAQLYRVYIGPKFQRTSLEKLQPQIDSEFGVSSMVRRYVP